MTKELQNTKKLTEDTKEEHEKSKKTKKNQVKIRVSVEREELDRLMKDMDNDSCIHCEKEVIDND